MNSAGEEGKMFVGGIKQDTEDGFVLVTDNDMSELLDASDAFNTKKQIQYAVNRLEAYVVFAGTSLAAVEALSDAELDKFFSRFFAGLRKTEDEFRDYFAKYGELTDCVLMRDQVTNRPRGFGFIRYKDPMDVQKVVQDAPHFLNGKRIDPKQCLPRNVSREMGRSGGGGIGSGDAPLSHKVFIGGVGQTSEEDIQKEFSKYGNVKEVVLMMDKVTNNCRGFGFVTFDNEDTVKKLCQMQYVQILDKRVECKQAQPRDSQGEGKSGGGWSNKGPMNQGGTPMGTPQVWNQAQGQTGWNQSQTGGFGGGFGQPNNFGGNFGQQGPAGFGGQQQQQPGGQRSGVQGGYGNYGNQNAPSTAGYAQPQNVSSYGGNFGQPQQPQQQQPQPNSYGTPQQNYGNYAGYTGQQQQPNMYGNQGAGNASGGYGAQQSYANPQQQQGANVGNNYAQEASGYGPQRVNYNNAAGYTQPAQGAAYGQQGVAANYNQQQQMQQQQPMQQQQQQQQLQQGNYGQPAIGGPPGFNYPRANGGPAAVPQAQTFHPYRR